MKHIAILKQPFYDMVLSGEKTIESRWSKNKIAPFNKVKEGDIILLKQTGKNVGATAKISKVECYNLTPQIAERIRKTYGNKIGINKFKNWEECANKKYCTLIWLTEVNRVNEIKVPRSNGAGWIVVKE